MEETSSDVSPCMWYYFCLYADVYKVCSYDIFKDITMTCAGESDRQVRRKNGAKNSILSGLGMYHLLRPIHT